MRVDGVIKEEVDFSRLEGLKSLEYFWDKKNKESVFSHDGIEHLIVHGVKADDFSVFENMGSLKRLEIIRGSFKNTDGIENLTKLKSLQLNNMSKLEDISAINQLNGLLDLGFGSCNKISYPQDVSGLKSLREFSMLKQKHVDSLAFISSLPKLEVLKAFEMSIKDGDIRFLQDISSLKVLLMDAKRHYNIDVNDFEKKLKDKYGDFEIDIFNEISIDHF